MKLHEAIANPSEWDALSAEPSPELMARMETLEASALCKVRLAALRFMLGQTEESATPATDHPLGHTLQLAKWIEQQEFQKVLSAPAAPLEGLSVAMQAEVGARVALERSKAQLFMGRYREAWKLALSAEKLAREYKMESLALVCSLQAEECQYSFDESELYIEDREAILREWVYSAPSLESRAMAYLSLVRLLVRRGLYLEAFKLTQELAIPANFRQPIEMMVMNHSHFQAQENSAQTIWGHFHAFNGLLVADADYVLAGLEPNAAIYPRPRSEWNLAFGWAYLSKGDYKQALAFFEATFIPRCEWDLRLLRNCGLIELILLAPEIMGEYQLESLSAEASTLASERIHPQSKILSLIPQLTPKASDYLARDLVQAAI